MKNKNIIIICASFWPDINPRSFRATELVKELCRQNYNVWVMKPNVSELQKEFASKHGFQFIDLGEFKTKSIIKSTNKFVNIINRVSTRLLQLLFEYPQIKLYFLVRNAIIQNKINFDLCISIAVPYPIHWGTASGLGKNKFTKRWIADCGDPFMGDESDSFKHPFYFKYIEKNFCKKADFLTVPTELSYKGYYREFWHKIKVIPQGFNFNEVKLSSEKHDYPCPAFGYAGGVIPNYREPFDFLDYLCNLDIDFRFIVYTLNTNYFLPYKKRLGEKLVVNEPKERLEVLYEFSKLDFVINFNNKGNKQTASKLIDYHIIDKPILNIQFREFDSSIFDSFIKRDYRLKYKIEQPEQYQIQAVVEKFLKL